MRLLLVDNIAIIPNIIPTILISVSFSERTDTAKITATPALNAFIVATMLTFPCFIAMTNRTNAREYTTPDKIP